MKIALIGYGKMGREVDTLAVQMGHEVVLRINAENVHELTKDNLSKADVAIEFTKPDSVVENLVTCFESSIPVVTGTTGWLDQLPTVKDSCQRHKGTLLYASNFSIGVQVFFQINNKLASMLDKLPEYDVRIEETHHLEKIDKPSGTAISLADIILKQIKRKKQWRLAEMPAASDVSDLYIHSHREEHIVGTHVVNYSSAIDNISLIHEAKNRKGFAKGAITTANWLKNKKGVFTMDDFMNDVFFSS